jgi:putative nucleotidyltransferase with HDIG domain
MWYNTPLLGAREGHAFLRRQPGREMATQRLEKIRQEVQEIGALPTLPETPLKILSLVADEESSMADIARTIETDPALAANILKVSNSPYYGVREKVGSLKLALTILGLNEIINIVTSISIVRMFPISKRSAGFNRLKFWRHCFGTGCAAQMLARELRFDLDGVEFVAGLIHDIGKLIIDQYFHSKQKEILSMCEKGPLSPNEAEVEVMGVDHATLGSWLAQSWHLPSTLVEAIEYHHRPLDVLTLTRPSEEPFLAAIVHLADILASEPDLKFTESCESSQTFSDDLSWKIILAERPDLNRQAIEALKSKYELYKEKVNELVTAVT